MNTVPMLRKSGILLPFLFWGLMLAGLSAGLTSCVGARFDQVALDNTTALSTQLPALMSKATGAFATHEAEAQSLLTKITDAYNHALSTKKNKDVAEQWRILRDDLVQPFITRWKESGKLSKAVVDVSTNQVKDALASITRAEKAKPK